MELVVDANILVAGFLRSATTRELLIDARLSLWSPEHGLAEAERVLTSVRFRKKLGALTTGDVRSLLDRFTANIRVAPATTYRAHLPTALRLAPHPEDAPYLALALQLGLPIWSNDAALGSVQQSVPVYSTTEILDRLHA